ncbi:PPK2 family polyphosphate kinase [Enteractinococcus coprophilus]|uniref:PPK2 family polyphosphate:nucleotide phosphotransferase n=1 Tax=Enteractinococcus coprophilus TaxID=1027633 RepID=A0A543A084_9MICC|nr:PPK2 family polyphosphate kinase [Enteractinococcus coprophilus]TQL66008.1 PPK2 family polyphosphate:nucleotide phosphotransferase [Enteractinococcus coprophilus]
MQANQALQRVGPFYKALREFAYDDGILVDLDALDCRRTPAFEDSNGETFGKVAGQQLLATNAERLSELQTKLFANAQAADLHRSVLLVIQGMDTSGKGGITKHVVGSMDPQGIHQVGFKKPTPEEMQHDFLWRIRHHTPRHGDIAVFDRSHYEDVLVHRVDQLTPPARLQRRYGSIRQFEQELAHNGTIIIKVMLHISREEQYERLSARLDDPQKHWKFTPADIDARLKWDAYMVAHRIAIEVTDKEHAPWFVIPADRKWYAKLAVQQLLIETLESLDLSWPPGNFNIAEQRRRLEASR